MMVYEQLPNKPGLLKSTMQDGPMVQTHSNVEKEQNAIPLCSVNEQGCNGAKDEISAHSIFDADLESLKEEFSRLHPRLYNNIRVRFNQPFSMQTATKSIENALQNLESDGWYTFLCQTWLQKRFGCSQALLVQSCTAALEMASILCEVRAGDEVIMPSYTFVSCANAFALRGAVPVFVDVNEADLCINVTAIENAITSRTKAILVVHYAGNACDMPRIMDIAERHKLLVIEDAAHASMSTYLGRPLGSFGHLGTLSFHYTKNLVCGEGGALIVRDKAMAERALVVWEKGTNRHQFLMGKVDKYSWVDLGSSFLPSELTAALLWSQLRIANDITSRRMHVWEAYHAGLAEEEAQGCLRRPSVRPGCFHNAHIYYVLFPSADMRRTVQNRLLAAGVESFTHYVPLHQSAGCARFGRAAGTLRVCEDVHLRMLRLPMHPGLSEDDLRLILSTVRSACASSPVSQVNATTATV